MNFVITGGSGFVGSYLIRSLAEKYPDSVIYNLDINPCDHGGKSVFVYCDVRRTIRFDAPLCADDVIFNLAAIHRSPGHQDDEYFDTNQNGAINVMEFASKYGIRHVIFTSSIAVYGASEQMRFETSNTQAMTPYGASKLTAEKTHRLWQATDPGRSLLILRPGVVFGQNENGNFERLYKSLRHGVFIYPGRKDTIKACFYVKELVSFMVYKLEHQSQPVEIYNCTYEPAPTISQIVSCIKSVKGWHRWTPVIPAWMLLSVSWILKKMNSPLGICPERVRKLMISNNICGQQLKQSGYLFERTFEEAVRDWLKDV